MEKETLKAVNVPRLRDGICVVQMYIYLNSSIQQVNMSEGSNKTKRPMLTTHSDNADICQQELNMLYRQF